MKKFGLFIGINRYREFDVSEYLSCADADAQALARVFETRLGFSSKVLTDTDLGWERGGGQEAIFDQLTEWKRSLRPEDEALLVVYFAGHGSTYGDEQFLLLPRAERPTQKPAVGAMGIISELALLDKTATWPKVKRVFIFDACRLGFGSQAGVQVGARAAYAPLREADVADKNLAVLRACPASQVAFELRNYGDDGKNHGLYTAALLGVIEQRVSADQAFMLDARFNGDVAREMGELAQRYAPEPYRARAQQQQPSHEGAAVCLADERDFAGLKIQRLLLEFEAHFAAERFHRPAAQCCGDTLRQLIRLDYPQREVKRLSDRIEVAERIKEEEQHRLDGERLIESARILKTPEAYLKLREQKFCEYEAEVAAFLAQWQREQDEKNQAVQAERRLADEKIRTANALLERQGALKARVVKFFRYGAFVLGAGGIVWLADVLTVNGLWELVNPVQDKPAKVVQASASSPSVLPGPVQERPAEVVTKSIVPPTFASASVKGSASSEPAPKECDYCPEMVLIPGGRFMMGSEPGASREKPVHPVQVAAFMMSKYEVTQGQWKAVMGNNPSSFKKCGDNCPVQKVSWNDVQAYVAKLNAKTGGKYRLPSEAEWEYAARAGSTGWWSFGDDEKELGKHAWYEANSKSTVHPVGLKEANKFGLHDMYGNVLEWVEDCLHSNYNGAPEDGSAWIKGCENGAERVLRGGGCYNGDLTARSAYRSHDEPGARNHDAGFRLAFRFSGPAGQ